MKILLFGEYSGLFNCLKDGLIANGHNVFLASGGDGYKNYPSDFRWDTKLPIGKFKHLIEFFNIYRNRGLLKGYDTVLLISPIIFCRYVFFLKPIFYYLIKHNKKVFISGAGLYPIGIKYWYETNEKYHNYVKGGFKDDPASKKVLYDNPALYNWENELLNKVNGYIPIWYEYAQPYRNHPKLLKTIRIPINIDTFNYKPNLVKDRIVFMLGLSNRSHSKGSQFIIDAFDIMRKKYNDIAEFIVAGGLPFNEYMELVERANVILDDANSYSIAMNGLFSLAKGKIVMGGAEPIANSELGLEYNPVCNINPDIKQICNCIEDIIKKKEEILEMGRLGRQFVEEYHDYREIAKQYIQIFENN